MTTTLFVPCPPGTARARLVAVIDPAAPQLPPGAALLPAYTSRRACVETHPWCVPVAVNVDEVPTPEIVAVAPLRRCAHCRLPIGPSGPHGACEQAQEEERR